MTALLLAAIYLVVLALNVDFPTFMLLLMLGITALVASEADREDKAWREALRRRIERRKEPD